MQATWGLPTAGDPPFCWGARAIWSPGRAIDILWDRQGWAGTSTEDERKALASWFNDRARSAMERQLEELCIDGSSCERVVVSGDGYRLTGTPNCSYGYLYVVCEPDQEATGTVAAPPKPKPKRQPRRAARGW
jgi:hypothetical protein